MVESLILFAVYYAPTFFKALGQSNDMALILSGMVNICQLVGTSFPSTKAQANCMTRPLEYRPFFI